MPVAGRPTVRINPVPIAVGLFIGCCSVHLLASLFSPFAPLAAAVLSTLALVTFHERLALVIKTGLLIFAATTAMLAYTLQAAQQRLDLRLTEPAVVQLQGNIADSPEATETGWRFDFISADRRYRLSSYTDYKLEQGQCWKIEAKLRPPRGMANPHIFDYEAWLLRKNISATGYIKKAEPCENSKLESTGGLRSWLTQRLTSNLADPSTTGLANALMFGDRRGITDQQWTVFRHTGTSHLVAISGLHIGLIAGAIFWLLLRLVSLSATLCLILPAQRWAAGGALLAALGYALLSGFDLPAQRASIMVTVAMLAVVFGQWNRPSLPFAIALIMVLLHDPFAPLAPGFWLSFAAVGWIIYLLSGRMGQPFFLWQWMRLQLGLTAALAPLCLFWFQESSWTGAIANPILIPLLGLYLPVLLLLGIPALLIGEPATGLLNILCIPLDWAWQGLILLETTLPGGWSVATPSLLIAVLATLGLILLFVPRGLPTRFCGLILVLPLFWPWLVSIAQLPPQALQPRQADIHVMDVGQGSAIFIRTQNHNLLFDAGPRFRSGFDTGEAVIAPYLKSLGINRLDRVLISHGDIDHRGGLDALRELLRIDTEINTERGPACRPGMHWQWDGVAFEVLHPSHDRWNDNNGSCVLKVAAGPHSLLLTGDIERQAEADILNRIPTEGLQANILIAPHHGSSSSSSTAFVTAVKPEHVIFTSGMYNRWGFPKPTVITRYRQAGAEEWQTGRDGLIRLQMGADIAQVIVAPYRETTAKYWRTRQ